jgi:CRP-like cAMP-binding protein
MERIFHQLSESMHLSAELKNDLASGICVKKALKGEVLVKEGRVCDHLFFIEKGALRGFHYHNGKEITSWFGFEDDFATSTYSFVSRKPGYEIVEAIENSTLYFITYEDLDAIYRKHPEFNYVGRLLTEKYYVDLMERTLCLQFQSAKENYEQLVLNRPHILQRVTLGHIASYLGISQETLSRIRTKK